MPTGVRCRPLAAELKDRPTKDPAGSGQRRWLGVDMLRGVAVLLVICRHHQATGWLGAFGWLGVDLFFVLSGFLVSGLIFDEYQRTGRFNATRFLIRRGFKIYPSFYALIIASTLLMWVTGKRDPLMNYVAEVFFFQNYHEGLWVQTWSLGVEEHFYLLLTFVAVLLIVSGVRFKWKAMVISCLLLFLFFLAVRFVTYPTAPFNEQAHMFPTHLRIDSLLAGVLLAACHRFRSAWFHRLFSGHSFVLFVATIMLMLPVLVSPYGSWTMSTIGFTGAYLAGAVVVGVAVARPWSASTGVLRSMIDRWMVRPLAWIGGISYTTYLWHLLVLLVVEIGADTLGLSGSLAEFIVFALGSLAMGWLASVIVERPCLRLRERWFSRTAASRRDVERTREREREVAPEFVRVQLGTARVLGLPVAEGEVLAVAR